MFGHDDNQQQQQQGDNNQQWQPQPEQTTPYSDPPQAPVAAPDGPAEPTNQIVAPTAPVADNQQPSPQAPTNDTSQPSEPTANASIDLLDIKQQALQELSPLVTHLEQSPEEKFKTTMMMIQASDDQSLVPEAYAAAQAITDGKAKAQALLDIVNEINYFTQHEQQQ